jgi:hypothetical protein
VTGAWARAAAVLAAVTACHSARPEAQPVAGAAAGPCVPPTGTLPPSATAAGLAGEYQLHITATAGPHPGEWLRGGLRLIAIEDPAAREIVVLGVRDSTSQNVLTGSTDLDPTRLGAVSTGELGSTAADAPGVLVIERHPTGPGAAADIMLRLGADANRRGRVRYDGGYFALTVRGIGPRGFTGTWASGTSGPSAAGYFCAERLSPGGEG